jgi:hypothetical protein
MGSAEHRQRDDGAHAVEVRCVTASARGPVPGRLRIRMQEEGPVLPGGENEGDDDPELLIADRCREREAREEKGAI